MWGWIDTYGTGRGPGWSPDLTGRRLIRWVNHALFLLAAQDKDPSARFFASLSRQTGFLAARWRGATPGLPRFEALTGLIYAGLSLKGCEALADPAVRGLSEECEAQIGADGGLPTRNPEELLEVFTLLNWAAVALQEAGRSVPPAHQAAIERIAPLLRALRHGDGGLARFHGGGSGAEGWLDQALANSHVPAQAVDGLAMGYSRLSHRRTTVLMDAAVPPSGAASGNAHACTLAFELTSGRRPVVVNCGSGATFGKDWRRAGRATPSHSTLTLDGQSSARLRKASGRDGRQELLTDLPTQVQLEQSRDAEGSSIEAAHDGYAKGYGLTHSRSLHLDRNGRSLSGTDLLVALDTRAKKRFEKTVDAGGLAGLAFDLRFHLHPEVDATLDLGGTAVSMALRSGEIWVFRHDGHCDLQLEPSVFLEKTRLKPRACLQIVLSGRAIQYATQIRWTLSKARDTGIATRDLTRDEDPEPYEDPV